ncbi:MAG: hypothetical protein WCK31_04255 [bacterium]
MKASLINKYNKVSQAGNLVRIYVYKITSGTADEVEDFEDVQGINYRVDEDGSPLFFTSNFEGNHVDLVKSKSKDKLTNTYSDVYRAMSSEMFELQRSMMTTPSSTILQKVVTKSSAKDIDITDGDM